MPGSHSFVEHQLTMNKRCAGKGAAVIGLITHASCTGVCHCLSPPKRSLGWRRHDHQERPCGEEELHCVSIPRMCTAMTQSTPRIMPASAAFSRLVWLQQAHFLAMGRDAVFNFLRNTGEHNGQTMIWSKPSRITRDRLQWLPLAQVVCKLQYCRLYGR